MDVYHSFLTILAVRREDSVDFFHLKQYTRQAPIAEPFVPGTVKPATRTKALFHEVDMSLAVLQSVPPANTAS